jgi:hypothetical protein
MPPFSEKVLTKVSESQILGGAQRSEKSGVGHNVKEAIRSCFRTMRCMCECGGEEKKWKKTVRKEIERIRRERLRAENPINVSKFPQRPGAVFLDSPEIAGVSRALERVSSPELVLSINYEEGFLKYDAGTYFRKHLMPDLEPFKKQRRRFLQLKRKPVKRIKDVSPFPAFPKDFLRVNCDDCGGSGIATIEHTTRGTEQVWVEAIPYGMHSSRIRDPQDVRAPRRGSYVTVEYERTERTRVTCDACNGIGHTHEPFPEKAELNAYLREHDSHVPVINDRIEQINAIIDRWNDVVRLWNKRELPDLSTFEPRST